MDKDFVLKSFENLEWTELIGCNSSGQGCEKTAAIDATFPCFGCKDANYILIVCVCACYVHASRPFSKVYDGEKSALGPTV